MCPLWPEVVLRVRIEQVEGEVSGLRGMDTDSRQDVGSRIIFREVRRPSAGSRGGREA